MWFNKLNVKRVDWKFYFKKVIMKGVFFGIYIYVLDYYLYVYIYLFGDYF